MFSRFFGELEPKLNILLGSTNSGKTSVLMNDAKDNAENNTKVGFISFEETSQNLIRFFNKHLDINIYCIPDYSLDALLELLNTDDRDIFYIDHISLVQCRKMDISFREHLRNILFELHKVCIKRNIPIVIDIQTQIRNVDVIVLFEEKKRLCLDFEVNLFSLTRKEFELTINNVKDSPNKVSFSSAVLIVESLDKIFFTILNIYF